MRILKYPVLPACIQIVLLTSVAFTMGCRHTQDTEPVQRSLVVDGVATVPSEPKNPEIQHDLDERITKDVGWFRFVRSAYNQKQQATPSSKSDRITISKFTPKKKLRAGLVCPSDVEPSFLKFCKIKQIFGPETLITEIIVSEVDGIPFSFVLGLTQDLEYETGAVTLVRIRDEDGDGVVESLLTSAVDTSLEPPEWVMRRIASRKD
ncbi:MAG: hypothetical protein UZ17_ACD001000011 [Acidobacteria bacterium OLB17]|nr:MAG: hypothetical protein UZ17_ACD001000011 [Acidobacteria bacterium OLB17]MCZ2391510.1 hypothetical protein [Acidobacteriota bacterium]